MPFWLYAWGAAGALLVSFLVTGFFATTPAPAQSLADSPAVQPSGQAQQGWGLSVLKGLSLATLALCIATGFFGSRDPNRNFNMTAFWVVFVLGFTYLTALIGDLYSRINPWATLVALVERARPGFARGRLAYPVALGDWPALAFYLAFIWIELFNFNLPPSLAWQLSAYTLLNLAGAWLVGAGAWFEHCEFFAVFLRRVALCARGFKGALRERPASLSAVVFVLFMLASTAFDGLRATQWWVTRFWADPYGIVQWLSGEYPMNAYARLRPWYVGWETFCLVAAPFVYFAAYAACVALARAFARSRRPLRELLLDFAYPLLPIALVYNFTHYFTLILTQGVKIVSLLSDPFGWGWNLFGTADLFRVPILPPLGLVWHAQVVLILLGHVAGVYLAHRVALRVFPSRRDALLSQLPMLLLMTGFTVAGLWILAQPLTDVLMR